MNPIDDILARSIIGGLPNTYILGNNAKRVTFHSQQHRAFNLIWALFESGRLKKGDRIAIIGGGLAGMTAAVACQAKECIVTIYEQAQTLLPLWRMNNHRYIHPNIYDWPKPGSQVELTSLPALNWHADFAKNVAEQIMEEWEFYSEDIIKETSCKVALLQEDNGKVEITTEPFTLETFDCVVIAVGFGIEKTHDIVNAATYWAGDAIDATPVTTGQAKKKILITGCGDGGLIDTLRLSLVNFDHRSYTEDFLQHPDFKALTEKIMGIENSVSNMDDQTASEEIYKAYKSLATKELTELLRTRLRNDTNIVLNSNGKSPLSKNASIHNRMLVSLLIDLRAITFKSGKAINYAVIPEGGYLVTIERPNGKLEFERVDAVIVRHGPKEILTELLGPNCTIPQNTSPDLTSQKLWQDEFYTELLSPTPNQQKYMGDQIGSLLRRIGNDFYIYKVRVGIVEKNNKPAYSLIFNNEAPDDFLQNLTTHKGYPIIIERNNSPVVSQFFFFGENSFDNNFPNPDLIVGAPIANHRDRITSGGKGFGTLGCFVINTQGQLGFISTSHSLLSANSHNSIDIDLLYDRDSSRFMQSAPVGKVKSVSQIIYHKYFSFENQENHFDAGLVIIQTSLRKPVYKEEIKVVKPFQIFVGQRVKKIGAGSGETEGRVTAVSCTVEVAFEQDTAIFSNIFEVKGIMGSFSTKGDSGALVMNDRGEAMGMIFAGNGNVSFVCPIHPILEFFRCRLVRTELLPQGKAR